MHLILLSPLLFSMHRLCLPLTLKHISLGCFTQGQECIKAAILLPLWVYLLTAWFFLWNIKHCMVGVSLNLISFIHCHLPRSNINIKYSTHFPMYCPLYFTLSKTDHFSLLQSPNIFHDPRRLLLKAKESTEDWWKNWPIGGQHPNSLSQ